MSLVSWIAGALLAAQATQPILLTLDEGFRLSEDDLRQISAVARDDGGASPWLITVQFAMVPGAASAEAFVQPTSERDGVRRGHVVGMLARPSDSVVRSWRYQSFADYAQVVVPGRTLNDVRGSEDPNRPFRVVTNFSDDELVSIVTFVRSQAVKWMGRETPIALIGRGAIRDARRLGADLNNWDSPVVRVHLWRDRSSQEIFELRRENGGWAAVHAGSMMS